MIEALISGVLGGLIVSAIIGSYKYVQLWWYNIWKLAFWYSRDKYEIHEWQMAVGHPLYRIPIGNILLTSGSYSIDYTHNIDNIKGTPPPWNWLCKHKVIYQGHNCSDESTIYNNGNIWYKLKRVIVKIAEYIYWLNNKLHPSKFRYSKYTFNKYTKYTIEFVYMLEQLGKGVSCNDIIHSMLSKLNENKHFRKSMIDAINTGYIIKVSNIKSQNGSFDILPYDIDWYMDVNFTCTIEYPQAVANA